MNKNNKIKFNSINYVNETLLRISLNFFWASRSITLVFAFPDKEAWHQEELVLLYCLLSCEIHCLVENLAQILVFWEKPLSYFRGTNACSAPPEVSFVTAASSLPVPFELLSVLRHPPGYRLPSIATKRAIESRANTIFCLNNGSDATARLEADLCQNIARL